VSKCCVWWVVNRNLSDDRGKYKYTRAHICTISPRDFHQRRLFSSLVEYNIIYIYILNSVNRVFFCHTHTHHTTHTHTHTHTHVYAKVKPRVYIILYDDESPVRDHGGGGGGWGPFNRVYFNTFGSRRDEEGTRAAIFFRLISSRCRFYHPPVRNSIQNALDRLHDVKLFSGERYGHIIVNFHQYFLKEHRCR